MGKVIRKFRPTNYWEIGAHESWLSDLASEGYFLTKFGHYFAHFEQGTPTQMDYRIDVSSKAQQVDEQIALYEQFGWDYVTSMKDFHIYRAAKNRSAIEIHTEPAEQAYTLQNVIKKLKRTIIFITLCDLVFIGLLLAIWLTGGTPILSLVQGYAIQQTVLAVVILYSGYTVFQSFIALRRLQKDLQNGRPIDHQAPWRKSFTINKIATCTIFIISVASLYLPIMFLIKTDTITLTEADSPSELIRLQQIEQNEALQKETLYTGESDEWGYYSTNWGPFTTTQLDTYEAGVIDSVQWADGSGPYNPSIETEIYEVSIQALVEPLVKDLIKRHTFDDVETTQLAYATLDHLYVSEQQEMREIYATKNNVVMYVRYFGLVETNDLIDHVATKINQF